MRKAKCTSLRTIFLSEKDLNFDCVPRGSRLKQAEREGRVQTLDLATNHSSEDVLSILKSKFPTLRNELELPKRLQFLQPGAQGNNGWNVAFYGVPTGQEIYHAFNRTKRMYFCLRTKDLSSSTTPTPATSDEGDNSDKYNQPLSTQIKKKESSKGEFLKEINLHSSFGVVVGTVREDEYEFGFLNQSITKGQMWYHTQALGDLCVVLENYHQACIQAKYSGRSLLICSGVEPDEPANYMLASFFRDVEDLEVKPLLCVCFEGTDDERAVSRNRGHGREPILLVLRAIGSNLGVVARAEDVNLSTFDGRVILKALSIKEKKEKKKREGIKTTRKLLITRLAMILTWILNQIRAKSMRFTSKVNCCRLS
ncbi:uncharacterized protein LOC116613509 isoform X7 [Nematostella vectensis]|uniref:uncharacterized protein LOC125561854 isoform X7 n=1 Tax=Nematostella vectensis TaxID=45351 RepID=UPI0020770263|nr:uncharacterized protein LOC125561854 isoform X7 [Nematostella vectensis]XP_048590179.1 uncharacterized protein LOC116613509 isoform X7 [Nematostella vectensis]